MALLESDEDLSEQDIDVLTVLECTEALLTEFYQEMGLMQTYFENAITKDWKPRLIKAMVEGVADFKAPFGLVSSFTTASRRAIKNGNLPVHNISSMVSISVSEAKSAVFYDQDTVSFGTDAFKSICKCAGIPAANVRREMAEKGLLVGAPTNSDSKQTRITVSVGNHTEQVRVYRLSRELFESCGEPPLF